MGRSSRPRGTVEETKETKVHYGVANFERRRHPRYSVDLPIEYSRGASESHLSGRAVNASEGGLLVYFPEKIEMGEILKMRLFFTTGRDLRNIEMVVQVVWIDIHLGDEGEDFRSGVRFIDIPSSDLVQLKNFLRGLSE